MKTNALEIKIRPMTRGDLDAVSSIDREIRRKAQAFTYVNITTGRVFSAGGKPKSPAHSDLDLKDVISQLLSLGYVAEAGGHVRAFILGRVAHARRSSTEIGTIAILGVHPDYQRRGIATRLVDALLEKFRTGEVKTVRIAHRGIDRHDKPLVDFVASIKTKS